MKSWDMIAGDKRLMVKKVTVDPINRERFAGSGWLVTNPKRISEAAFMMFGSSEDGWEHVSVSHSNRCPTWDEMCMAKDVFWRDDEACYELHPVREVYINMHKYCLHIWRPKDGKMILPPDAVPKKEGQKSE